MSDTGWLKDFTRRMIDRVGERKEVAARLNVKEMELSYWTNPNHSRFIPLDHFVDLLTLAGDEFLKEFSTSVGRAIDGEKQDANIHTLLVALAELVKRSSNVVYVGNVALSDHHLCNREKTEIRSEIGGVINICHTISEAMQ